MTPSERATYIIERYREGIVTGKKEDLHALLVFHFEDISKVKAEPCKEHPKYQGKRKPRTTCESCWRYYLFSK